VEVVDQIMTINEKIPRPENLITTTKKLHQMSIPSEYDELYQKVKKEVGRISRDNI
jgi:hypothetical protein